MQAIMKYAVKQSHTYMLDPSQQLLTAIRASLRHAHHSKDTAGSHPSPRSLNTFALHAKCTTNHSEWALDPSHPFFVTEVPRQA